MRLLTDSVKKNKNTKTDQQRTENERNGKIDGSGMRNHFVEKIFPGK